MLGLYFNDMYDSQHNMGEQLLFITGVAILTSGGVPMDDLGSILDG